MALYPAHVACYCSHARNAVFRDIAEACWSVVLTSGTLSPLETFAGELGAQFPVRRTRQDAGIALALPFISGCQQLTCNSLGDSGGRKVLG
jgi:hypothetical protein